MKKKLRNYSIHFVKEIIPVIVGILIALYINNWNENRKEKKYINQIFTSIDKELIESKQEIETKIPLQKTLIDTIDFYSDNKNLTIFDVAIKADGIHIPTIKLNTWKSLSNSKIELAEYKKMSVLSGIEEKRELLRRKEEYLMNFLYSNIDSKEKSKKQTLKILMQDILQTEKSIQNDINEYEKLKK